VKPFVLARAALALASLALASPVLAQDAAGQDGGAVAGAESLVGGLLPPSLRITSPGTSFSIADGPGTLVVAGTVSTGGTITSITWTCAECASRTGTATYDAAAGTWRAELPVTSGTNHITVTASDDAGLAATASLAYAALGGGPQPPVVKIDNPGGVVRTEVVTLRGTCDDDVGCVRNVWRCETGCVWSLRSNGGDAGHAPKYAAKWEQKVALVPGRNVITVTGVDSEGNTGSDTIDLTYEPQLEMLSFSLDRAEEGRAYSQALAARGGSARRWSVAGGGLPSGLALSSDGVLRGTPGAAGTFPVTIRVEADGSHVDRTFNLYVSPRGRFAGPNDYFDNLCARPEAQYCAGLRSQADINRQQKADGDNPFFTYDFAGDTYFDKQDAAKFSIAPMPCASEEEGGQGWNKVGKCHGSDLLPVQYQLDLQLWADAYSTNTYVVIWDQWVGVEARDFLESHGTWKHFQFKDQPESAAPADPSVCINDPGKKAPCHEGTLNMEIQSRWNRNRCPGGQENCPNAFAPSLRVYGKNDLNPVTMQKSGAKNPVDHTGAGTFPLYGWNAPVGKWMRYIVYIEGQRHGDLGDFDEWKASCAECASLTDGPWTRYSIWVLDEDRDAQRFVYRMPWLIRQRWTSNLNFEFNTSAVPEQQVAPVTLYYRNGIVLKNYRLVEGDPVIFQRPLR
jgi:hypothetical protein